MGLDKRDLSYYFSIYQINGRCFDVKKSVYGVVNRGSVVVVGMRDRDSAY